jgi:hypothetical protein
MISIRTPLVLPSCLLIDLVQRLCEFGEITFKDMGDYKWRGNCFNLVELIYVCYYNSALRIIDKDFNLGISFNKDITAKKVINWLLTATGTGMTLKGYFIKK